MTPPLPPWHKDHLPSARLDSCYLPGSGRRPCQVRVDRTGTKELLESGELSAELFEARTPDTLVFPAVARDGGRLFLDTARLKAELTRDGAAAPKYSTAVMSRAALAVLHDRVLEAYGEGGERTGGDFAKLDFGRMVGRVMPIFGPTPRKVKDTSTIFAPITPGEPHDFAFRPVIIATPGDGRKGDQGEVVGQGVVLTPRGFNFKLGDPRRVSVGLNPAFEDTLAWVLVTHAFSPPVTYARMNKESMKKRRRDPEDEYERRFMWEAYRDHNRAALQQPGFKISNFGLTDTKQTNKLLLRAIVPWGIPEVGAELRRLREACGDPTLRDYLVTLPMKQPESAEAEARDKGGMDLRRMLMEELLLMGTPLEPLLRGEQPLLDADVHLPANAADLFARMAS